MANFETVISHTNANIVRVIVAALRAHGFHPLDVGNDGLPGLPGVTPRGGIQIKVPSEEAVDAKLLAEDLLKEMLA